MRNLLVHKHFYLWLAEFWTLLIAYLSLSTFKKLPSLGVKSADKYVHFTFYFVFTILWFIHFKKKPYNFNRSSRVVVIKVFSVAVLYGIAIEIAQSIFTTSRKGDILDVLANTTGALIAVFLVILWSRFLKKNVNQIK